VPVAKGKKRKRQRRRSLGDQGESTIASVPAPAPAAKTARVTRQRRQPPYWVNAIIGVVILITGIFFFLYPEHGVGTTQKVVFLVLYFVLSGFYLGRAWQAYRRTRG
jgi:uncharacterized membrane protein HdeD (DUF308 family)